MSQPITLLYVPGDRPDRIGKALKAGADTVIIDLEDAVVPNRKPYAREAIREVLATNLGSSIQVRINAIDTPWFADDTQLVEGLSANVEVRVPKVESAMQVRFLARKFRNRGLHLLIESASGVENIFQIAHEDASVRSLGLGELDLRSDLGVHSDSALDWTRARLVCASRAAGLGAPAMSVYARTRDEEGLRESCRRGRELGFVGRAALHPSQLPIIRQAFCPSEREFTAARQLLENLEAGINAGNGAMVLADGTFIDVAAIGAAVDTVQLYERLQDSIT